MPGRGPPPSEEEKAARKQAAANKVAAAQAARAAAKAKKAAAEAAAKNAESGNSSENAAGAAQEAKDEAPPQEEPKAPTPPDAPPVKLNEQDKAAEVEAAAAAAAATGVAAGAAVEAADVDANAQRANEAGVAGGVEVEAASEQAAEEAVAANNAEALKYVQQIQSIMDELTQETTTACTDLRTAEAADAVAEYLTKISATEGQKRESRADLEIKRKAEQDVSACERKIAAFKINNSRLPAGSKLQGAINKQLRALTESIKSARAAAAAKEKAKRLENDAAIAAYAQQLLAEKQNIPAGCSYEEYLEACVQYKAARKIAEDGVTFDGEGKPIRNIQKDEACAAAAKVANDKKTQLDKYYRSRVSRGLLNTKSDGSGLMWQPPKAGEGGQRFEFGGGVWEIGKGLVDDPNTQYVVPEVVANAQVEMIQIGEAGGVPDAIKNLPGAKEKFAALQPEQKQSWWMAAATGTLNFAAEMAKEVAREGFREHGAKIFEDATGILGARYGPARAAREAAAAQGEGRLEAYDYEKRVENKRRANGLIERTPQQIEAEVRRQLAAARSEANRLKQERNEVRMRTQAAMKKQGAPGGRLTRRKQRRSSYKRPNMRKNATRQRQGRKSRRRN